MTVILGFLLGGVVVAAFFFMGGQLLMQRRQVIELRQTNVSLFQENQNVKAAYQHLQAQVQKIQEGPIAAFIGLNQIEQIAEITAAKLDMKSLRGTELTKRDVN